MNFKLTVVALIACFLALCHGFRPLLGSVKARAIANSRHRELSMGFLDGIFGPKKTASASHILVKGNNAPAFLSKLKEDLNASKDVKAAFAEAAAQYSSCPSGKKGGALGTFKQGAMVPAFDKVVFSEEVGVIHGP
eukprot:gene31689-38297_t